MIASVIYWALRRLVELLVLRRRSDDGKEAEILVLRHELAVLRRQVARRVARSPTGSCSARACPGASARSAGSLFVRPETIRRWHSELVARRWTYRRDDRPASYRCVQPRARASPRAREPDLGFSKDR